MTKQIEEIDEKLDKIFAEWFEYTSRGANDAVKKLISQEREEVRADAQKEILEEVKVIFRQMIKANEQRG